MKKDFTLVKKGLVVEVSRFEKSHIKGWVAIYSKKGERMGGFSMLDNKMKVLDKFEHTDILYITYSIIDRGAIQ